jgi:hypothetical protein
MVLVDINVDGGVEEFSVLLVPLNAVERVYESGADTWLETGNGDDCVSIVTSEDTHICKRITVSCAYSN